MKAASVAIGFLFFLVLPASAQEAAAPATAKDSQVQMQASAAEILSLEDAIRLALVNNRLLRVAELEAEKAGDQVATLRTRRLPSSSVNFLGTQLLNTLSFEFAEGVFGTFPGIGPVPAQDTRITTPRRPNAYVIANVSQPLSQLYKINLNIRQGEFSREVAQEKVRSQRQSVINNVKRLYYAALESESALEVSEESLKLYRELDRLTGEYVLQQVALKSDNLDAKARLANAEYEALTLRNALATRKEQLNQVLGRDIRSEFRLNEVPPVTPLEADLQAAQARALAQRPEVREAKLKMRQAEQDRRIKRAEYIPDVSLSLNYISPFRIEVLPKNITTLGFQVSWEPWDWGRRKRELDEKGRTIEQAQNGVREAETQVLVEVNQRYRSLAEARALLHAADAARESAREKLRVVKNRFGEQASLLKDVLLSQTAFTEAGHNYRRAVLSFWTARADFEKAVGEEP